MGHSAFLAAYGANRHGCSAASSVLPLCCMLPVARTLRAVGCPHATVDAAAKCRQTCHGSPTSSFGGCAASSAQSRRSFPSARSMPSLLAATVVSRGGVAHGYPFSLYPCGSESVAPSCQGNRPEGLRRQSAFCRARPMREPIRREATTQRSAAPVRGTDMRRAGHRVDQHGVVAASRHRAAARAAINRSIAADTSRAEDVLRRCHAPQSDSTKDGSHARDAADITNQCGRLSRR
jgi:hypothetical protein